MTKCCDSILQGFSVKKRSHYLVIKHLPVPGISEVNARGWEIEDNLSAKDIIIRYTSKPEKGL